MLTFAYDYPTYLLAALGVGISGGSFSVGIAYVAKWFPEGRQGTALGIFGAGNVGAAVTKFAAPFVMVAYGWHTVALVGPPLSRSRRSCSCDDKRRPDLERAARSGQKPEPLSAMLATAEEHPGLALLALLFFVFGGFVALALWLPRYLIGVYGLDVTTAGMIGAMYSIPASLFRPMADISPISTARGGSCTGPSRRRGLHVYSVLPADPVHHGGNSRARPVFERIRHRGFIVVAFVLGFFMSIGKAAVYKHIPVYYPDRVGAVGGVVGLVGGLGGFVLPIVFGALNDLTGIWQSCFWLMFAIVSVCIDLDASGDPNHGAHGAGIGCRGARVAGVAGDAADPYAGARGRVGRNRRHSGLAARGQDLLGPHRPRNSPPQSVDFGSVPAVVVRSLDGVVRGRREAAFGRFRVHQRAIVLARLDAGSVGRDIAGILFLHAGDLWRSAVDDIDHLVIGDPGGRDGVRGAESETPYWIFLSLALLCGLGGGNFASSMANISFFFPKAEKGSALAINAGLGNLGVSVVQFIVPLAITAGVFGWLGGAPQTAAQGAVRSTLWLQNAGFVFVPFIVASAIGAWFGMDDIATMKASFTDQSVIFRRTHNWVMCWLYTGTFGSFIGFSAAFPLLTRILFPDINALKYAFLGPLVGALARAAAGKPSDRIGGGRITFWVFAAMSLGTIGILYAIGMKTDPSAFPVFFASFLFLFAASGVGNASTFQMIPAIMRKEVARLEPGMTAAELVRQSDKESAAIIGFTSAIAAYGAFFIPKSFGTSIAMTGGAEWALYLFLAFYVSCIAMTWWFYTRRGGLLFDIEHGGPKGSMPVPASGD